MLLVVLKHIYILVPAPELWRNFNLWYPSIDVQIFTCYLLLLICWSSIVLSVRCLIVGCVIVGRVALSVLSAFSFGLVCCGPLFGNVSVGCRVFHCSVYDLLLIGVVGLGGMQTGP